MFEKNLNGYCRGNTYFKEGLNQRVGHPQIGINKGYDSCLPGETEVEKECLAHKRKYYQKG